MKKLSFKTTVKILFFFLVVMIIIAFIGAQFLLPPDTPLIGGSLRTLDVTLTATDSTVAGDTVSVLDVTIPADITENDNTIYIISSEMHVYVDGEKRIDYEGAIERSHGKTATAFVEVPISTADAGKQLTADIAVDPGGISNVYLGDRFAFWRLMIDNYVPEFLVGIIALALGLVAILGGVCGALVSHRYISIIDLGVGVSITSSWIITNSVFRQIIFPSLSVTSNIPFIIIASMAYPYLSYVDSIQKERYSRIIRVIQIFDLSVLIFNLILYIFDIDKISNFFILTAGSAALSMLIILITLILDIINKSIKDYLYAAIGLFCVMGAGIIQIAMYFSRSGVFSGFVVALGLIEMVFFSMVHAFLDFSRLTVTTAAAVASNKAKDNFLANISHEIRTPINAILGMDEVILRETKDEQIRGYALDIQNASKNLLAIVNDILDFSKIESGMMDIVPKEYDVRSLFHDILLMIRIKADEKKLSLVLDVDENIPSFLYGDEKRIRQVFVNLLSNALKYTDSGTITWSVSCEKRGNSVLLKGTVKDTGIGMKPDDLTHLFDRFIRVDKNKNYNVEGTGLGLAITSQLLNLMDSKLNVVSEYGVGSTFSFELMQEIVNPEPVGNISNITDYQPALIKSDKIKQFRGEGRILVVDDQRMNRKVIMNLLKNTGLTIEEAESGMECLMKTTEKKYDMILLDHMMPKMDGIETMEHLKDDGTMQGRPIVIAMTANAVREAEKSYIEKGFDGYLSKPVLPEELNRVLFRWLKSCITEENEADTISSKVTATASPETSAAEEQNTGDTPENKNLTAFRDWLVSHPELKKDYATQFYPDEKQYYLGLTDFYEEIYPTGDKLDDIFLGLGNESSLDDYRIQVHAMKSMAYSIGAVSVGGVAELLETAARKEDRDVVTGVTSHFLAAWFSQKEQLGDIEKLRNTIINW